MPLLRRVAFCQKGVSSQTFVKKLTNEPSGGRAGFPISTARGSRLETEFIGFAGNRARTVTATRPPCPFLPTRGSRPETEFTGFAGNRARTPTPSGPPCPFFPARSLRPETEFIGFAGNRARTLMPSGPAFSFPRPKVRASKRNTFGFRALVIMSVYNRKTCRKHYSLPIPIYTPIYTPLCTPILTG